MGDTKRKREKLGGGGKEKVGDGRRVSGLLKKPNTANGTVSSAERMDTKLFEARYPRSHPRDISPSPTRKLSDKLASDRR